MGSVSVCRHIRGMGLMCLRCAFVEVLFNGSKDETLARLRRPPAQPGSEAAPWRGTRFTVSA